MRGYSAVKVFGDDHIYLYGLAMELVYRLDDKVIEDHLGVEFIRCHELARAIHQIFTYPPDKDGPHEYTKVVDGYYGAQ